MSSSSVNWRDAWTFNSILRSRMSMAWMNLDERIRRDRLSSLQLSTSLAVDDLQTICLQIDERDFDNLLDGIASELTTRQLHEIRESLPPGPSSADAERILIRLIAQSRDRSHVTSLPSAEDNILTFDKNNKPRAKNDKK